MTLLSDDFASTLWPPVTFEKPVFDNSVGMNCGGLWSNNFGFVPLRTWYVKSASSLPVSLAATSVEPKYSANASSEGAKTSSRSISVQISMRIEN